MHEHDRFKSDDLEIVRKYSVLASGLWGKTFSGLTATAFSQLGERFVNDLWYAVLTSHQDVKYNEGLRKLGIHEDPPAVAAAKYHYFTNIIGGLDMEYVEESPKKVWIRYLSPMWTYAGTALLAMPASVRRTIFSAWHPRNGELMGVPELGYVGTKFVMETEPYDEGYFIEHDAPLPPDRVMQFEAVRSTPEFDPATAPVLDPELWPEARMLKARPKFSSGYAQSTVDCLYHRVGEHRTHQIVATTMRGVAIQFLPDLMQKAGVQGDSLDTVTDFLAEILRASRRSFEVIRNGSTSQFRILDGNPFDESYSPELQRAFFEFAAMAARRINGHVAAEWSSNGTVEEWTLTDTGRWLW